MLVFFCVRFFLFSRSFIFSLLFCFHSVLDMIPPKSANFKEFLNLNIDDENYHSISSGSYTETEFNSKFDCLKISNIKLSVIHVNIRSLNANYSKLLQLLVNLNVQFDVIVLSEIWSTNIQFLDNIIPNYNFFYDIPDYSKVGGVGIFVNNKYTAFVREDLKIENSIYKIENIFLEVKIQRNTFIVGGIYRHPNNNVAVFRDDLECLLQKINKINKVESLITGDVNIDLLRYESHLDTKKYIETLFAHNFLPYSFIPTRITDRSSTIIDHFYFSVNNLTNLSSKIFTGNIVNDLSDHLINYFILPASDTLASAENRPYCRFFPPRNKQIFIEHASSIDWPNLLDEITDPMKHITYFMII